MRELERYERDYDILKGIGALLHWDKATEIPSHAIAERAAQMSAISMQMHALQTAPKLWREIRSVHEDSLSAKDRARVRRVRKDTSRARKLPEAHVRAYTELIAVAEHEWEQAKAENQYARFKPYLKRIVEMKRAEARYIDKKRHPYTILMDEYEEGMDVETVRHAFSTLAASLKERLDAVKASRTRLPRLPRRIYPFDRQRALAAGVAQEILGDDDRYVVKESIHPFTSRISPNDVRITIACRERNPMFSFSASMHEAGHALYELNFHPRYRQTALFEAASYGLHESQSRFWENNIGLSEEFWRYYAPKFRMAYPQLKGYTYHDMFRAVNRVEPGLIRIEADEITYPFHIIIRFECELALIEGRLSVDDLPRFWNEKYREYLGITPPDDAQGVLQDVHWSIGAFGYFPSYLIGTIYASMLRKKMGAHNPHLPEQIANGDFSQVKSWLATKIQQHARIHTAEEIITKACGRGLDPNIFVDYLHEKYARIYRF